MNSSLIVLREMQLEDWPQVRAIFQEGIETNISTLETEPPDWDFFDKNHLQNCRIIALIDNNITGWAALTPASHRKAYQGVAEVSIYIANNFKKKGIGSKLMENLISCSEKNGIWTLQSIVFPENKPSIKLHYRFGFRLVGYRERIAKNRKGQWQDTLLMERRTVEIS